MGRSSMVALALLLLGAGPKKKAGPAGAAGTAKPPAVSKLAVPAKPPRMLVFDPIRIEGRIPKPKAIYTLERSRASFEDLSPDDDFVPRIPDSVEGEPF